MMETRSVGAEPQLTLSATHQSSPGDTVHIVLYAKDRARSRSEDEEFDVVEDQGDDLQQSSSSSGERSGDLSRKRG